MNYRVYGCHLVCDRPLISLPACESLLPEGPCLHIRTADSQESLPLQEMEHWQSGLFSLGGCTTKIDFLQGESGYAMRFPGHAAFMISWDGRSVTQYCHHGVDPSLLQDLLLGPIFACALSLQGIFALHGSSVACGETAIGFLGPGGRGKSTLTTACVDEGWNLVSDGMMVARGEAGGFYAQPGYPSIRLRQDAAQHFSSRASTYPIQGTERGKHRLCVNEAWGRFEATPRRLTRLYLLEPNAGEGPTEIVPCTGWDAFRDVMLNTYAVTMYADPIRSAHLMFLTRLLSGIPLRRFRYSKGMDNIPRMLALLCRDFRESAV